MINTLNDKPVIGMIAGAFSGTVYIIKSFLTDDDILKYAAGVSIWIGLLVALLTAYLKVMEIARKHEEKKLKIK